MTKVALGFLGCGFMGQRAHLPNFLQSDKCEVLALCEARPRLAKLVAEQHQIPKIYHSVEQLAADNDIQAVAAIARETLNAQLACTLLAAGKHVYLEKPMTTNSEAGRRMLQAARAGGAKLMIAYMKRYDEGVRRAKALLDDLLASGELGALTFVRAECFGGDWITGMSPAITTDEPYPDLPATGPPDWLPADRRADFNRLNNVYCHNINLVRFLLDRDLTVVHADLSRAAWVIIFDADGVTVTLEVGMMSAHAWHERTELYFERGKLELLTPPPLLREVPARVRLYQAGDAKQYLEPIAPWSWAFRNEAEHFLDCLRENREPASSGADSLRDLLLVEEAFRRDLQV